MNEQTITIYLDMDETLIPEPLDQGWRAGWVEVKFLEQYGRTYEYAPELMEAINGLAQCENVRFVWVTAREHEAIQVGQQLGLDCADWPVLIGDQHGVHGDQWWKLEVIRADQQAHPSPFIWIDDELMGSAEATSWAYSTERALLICPPRDAGITWRQWDTVLQVVEDGLDPASLPRLHPVGTIQDMHEPMVSVHSPQLCGTDRPCVIHRPSEHHMRGWPLNWRWDRGIFERICEHGIGHPDPDDAAYRHSVGDHDTVHGCDGCCAAAHR